MDKTKLAVDRPVRPKRKPVSQRGRLELTNTDPNREYRLINAEAHRMSIFEEGGWKIENIKDFLVGGQRTDVATPIDNTVSVGGGQKQVLVSIEKEFYNEDQKSKAEKIDATEAGMKPKTSEGQYGSIQIGYASKG